MNGLLARSQNPGPFFFDGETRTQDLTDMRGRVRGWPSDPIGPCARVCSNVCRAHASRAAASQSGSSIFGDTKLPTSTSSSLATLTDRSTDPPDYPRSIAQDVGQICVHKVPEGGPLPVLPDGRAQRCDEVRA